MSIDLSKILMDSNMASFGDVLVNFVYSLALSRIRGRFHGDRVKNRVLAEALCKCGLRDMLSGKVDTHVKGNAAEALIAYAWISGKVSLNELVDILSKNFHGEGFKYEVEAFSELLKYILVKVIEN
ncbi:MAG: hypothetical protein N3E39_04300 [Candidatus Methanomethylicia archaeon]|nr:hypothetical protein [Candidatus Methanomethylicia archaeon]